MEQAFHLVALPSCRRRRRGWCRGIVGIAAALVVPRILMLVKRASGVRYGAAGLISLRTER